MSKIRFTRRHFFYGTLLAGAIPSGGFGSVPSLKILGYKSPNEKLNIAGIGAGGQAFDDLIDVEQDFENIVALADVDWDRGKRGLETWPKAAKYKDFRKMLEKSGKDIDAVVIAVPDHMHAICALACMQMGKHVYLEKPLTRTSWEARLLTQAAVKYGVATQMGNHGYSHEATRVACEIIWSGEIGEVREVHGWFGIPTFPQGMTKIPPPTPIPETLEWDLWLGGAEYRPYTAGDQEFFDFVAERNKRILGAGSTNSAGSSAERPAFYLPTNWRGFYDFGTTCIGDWAIHILGPANWALKLKPEYLLSVECIKKDKLPPFTYPDELTLKFEFGPRPGMPPVTVYWYHHQGGDAYTPPGMTAQEARKITGKGPQVGPMQDPAEAKWIPATGSGYNCIFAGSKGYMGTSGRGESVGLIPGSRWADYNLPVPYLTRSPGANTGSNHAAHCRDWVRACKGGAVACSNFSIAGPYTEWMLLGTAAIHAEGKLMWDNAKGEFSNNKEANKWIKPSFRKGWGIKL